MSQDEADRRDAGMVEDGVNHFLVAMDDLQQAWVRPPPRIIRRAGSGVEGARSDGFRIKALPAEIAMPNIRVIGIIAGKLNGVIPH